MIMTAKVSRPLPEYSAIKDLEVFEPPEAAVFLRLHVKDCFSASKAMRRLPIRKSRLGHTRVRYLRTELLKFVEGHTG
ncbi:MAG: hypothetical protein HOP28_12955 [Gemmatimonadales bacterium]|nr:hypothetical protein [Gemmatimonadales bacterium]